ncbi:MAG: hemerythrin family protein [Candidatus Marinimicrobia bacterium]|nr:hemerythrin family protein [Candidatus Neomarinimicrobiota bacterium]
MSLFLWDPAYSIDHGVIDDEHKRLLGIARRVLDIETVAGKKEEIKDIVKEFYDYARTHFEHEEKLMAEIQYPLLEKHKKKHAEIVADMNHYLSSDTYLSQLLSDFRVLAIKWVLNHILDEDLQIRDFLKTQT